MNRLILLLSLILILKTNVYDTCNSPQSLWGSCGCMRQSPINIETYKAKRYAYSRPLDTSSHYRTVHPSIYRVNLQEGNFYAQTPLIVTGGPVHGERYQLSGIHFHWGHGLHDGTDHRIDGVAYAMEVHMIHTNVRYRNMQEALNNTNGLLKIAVLLEVRQQRNPQIDFVLRHFQIAPWTPIQLAYLYPDGLANGFNYWTYDGSLTVPGHCQEAVTWIIVANPLLISYRQLREFQMVTHLHAYAQSRPVQPLNGRTVKFLANNRYN